MKLRLHLSIYPGDLLSHMRVDAVINLDTVKYGV